MITMRDVTLSLTAAEKKIDNSVPPELMTNTLYAMTVVQALEPLIASITSWYRCPILNTEVGGVPTSWHTKCLAIDFRPKYDKMATLDAIMAMTWLPIRKVIVYDDTGHVHISLFVPGERRSGATAYVKRAGKYIPI